MSARPPSISRAFRVIRRSVVAFTGGGGKTSAMFRLASELRAAGWRVVSTTTTRIGAPQVSLVPRSIRVEELSRLSTCLDKFGHCLVVGMPAEDGKMSGISAELVAQLHARPDIDAVLIEADGSRLKPFKAPAGYEPVVPPVATHLVAVVGADAFGRPLNAEFVHRPHLVTALTGLPPGDPVTPEIVARVLVHPEGGAKQLPSGALFMALINKADQKEQLDCARKTAQLLLKSSILNCAAIASMTHECPVKEVWGRIAGVILAAGLSSRFGSPKQLLPWHGTTLVRRAVEIARSAALDPIVVVTGFAAERVVQEISDAGASAVHNADFPLGQGTSVRTGASALPAKCAGAVFLLVDQPGVQPETIRRLVQEHRETLAPAVVPVFDGRRGNPVLFDRALFEELQSLTGDVGGRALLERHADGLASVPVADASVLEDIDTPADFMRADRITGSSG